MTGLVRRSRELDAATACCGAALLSLVPVAAHQLGLLRHLPDPPGEVWDSDGITGSAAARPLGVPDGLLGLGNFSVTLGLLLAARRCEGARRLLGWKLLADGSAAGFNVVRQVVTFRRLCSWCMGTAVAAFGTVYFGARGLRRAGLL